MTTKDLIYIALIALSGLIFYLHGLDAGVRQTRRLFQRYLKDPKAFTEVPAQPRRRRSSSRALRAPQPVVAEASVQGMFGKN
jgi:hypothetical protein